MTQQEYQKNNEEFLNKQKKDKFATEKHFLMLNITRLNMYFKVIDDIRKELKSVLNNCIDLYAKID